jgi:hypothetical protein
MYNLAKGPALFGSFTPILTLDFFMINEAGTYRINYGTIP